MNGLRALPLINGVEPAWANLTVNIAGFPEVGIRAIEYSEEQAIENIYGAGQRPVGRGYGRIEVKGKVTLLRTAVESMREASPSGRLSDIAPFDIIVMFVPVQGGKIIQHKLRNCQFTTDGLNVTEGDTSIATDFDLVVSHIEWN